MKKILCLILCMVLLCGCSESDPVPQETEVLKPSVKNMVLSIRIQEPGEAPEEITESRSIRQILDFLSDTQTEPVTAEKDADLILTVEYADGDQKTVELCGDRFIRVNGASWMELVDPDVIPEKLTKH